MESSRRDLFIDIVIDRFIFKTNQINLAESVITLSACFTCILKVGMGLYLKQGLHFTVSVHFRTQF